jgi:PKD repeat protein
VTSPDSGDDTNQGPSAVISATPTSGAASLVVSVDASQSSDDQGIVSYRWDFGDGSVSELSMTTHTYSTAGDYTLSLTVTDGVGAADSTSVTIHVTSPQDGGDVTIPVGVTHFDDFEYTLDRDSASDPTGVNNAFVSQGALAITRCLRMSGFSSGSIQTTMTIRRTSTISSVFTMAALSLSTPVKALTLVLRGISIGSTPSATQRVSPTGLMKIIASSI